MDENAKWTPEGHSEAKEVPGGKTGNRQLDFLEVSRFICSHSAHEVSVCVDSMNSLCSRLSWVWREYGDVVSNHEGFSAAERGFTVSRDPLIWTRDSPGVPTDAVSFHLHSTPLRKSTDGNSLLSDPNFHCSISEITEAAGGTES